MFISKEKAGALMFLVLSIVYGWHAHEIRMLPGDELEPFNAQTMPIALAWMTGIVSFLLLILPQRKGSGDFVAAFLGLNWGRTALLMVLMVFYGLTLTALGFILSTFLFLVGGILALGECRWQRILPVAIILPVVFWFILTQLLDVYLAKGEVFLSLGWN